MSIESREELAQIDRKIRLRELLRQLRSAPVVIPEALIGQPRGLCLIGRHQARASDYRHRPADLRYGPPSYVCASPSARHRLLLPAARRSRRATDSQIREVPSGVRLGESTVESTRSQLYGGPADPSLVEEIPCRHGKLYVPRHFLSADSSAIAFGKLGWAVTAGLGRLARRRTRMDARGPRGRMARVATQAPRRHFQHVGSIRRTLSRSRAPSS